MNAAIWCVIGCVSWASPTAAQHTSRLAPAAATITAADLTRHIGVLAADSMRGRATPSPELEGTARYLAAHFQQLGLVRVDGRGDTSLIWNYPVPGQLLLDSTRSQVSLALPLANAGKPVVTDALGDPVWQEVWKNVSASFTGAAYFAPEVGPATVAEPMIKSTFSLHRTGSAHSVVLAGRLTAASVPVAAVRDQVVFYLPAPDADSATRQQILAQLYATSAGVIVVSDRDSAHFAAALQRARQPPVRVVEAFMREARGERDWPWAVVVRSAAVDELLAAAGVDVARLRAAPTPVVRPLPPVQAWLDVVGDTAAPRQTAPLVAAVLEGTDSLLKGEYVVVTAHMDATGVSSRPGHPDLVDSGADDNASGTAGLLALAKAFSQPGARPRRSLLFVATSGGARGTSAWGANAYVYPWEGGSPLPPVKTLAGVLNLDGIGRLAGDTLAIDGLQDVEFAQRPAWVAAEHPELGLVLADGGTVLRPTSDHFSFARRGVPSVFIHTGTHAAAARTAVADTAAVNAGDTERILRFVFYLTASITNADRRPRWTAGARWRFATLAEP